MKIKLFTASILVFVILIGLGQTEGVQAADSLDDKKKNVEENLNKVEKDILATADKVNGMNEDISVLEAAIASNNKEVESATNEVNKYNDEIKTLKNEIEKLEKEIKERNVILKERLSSYQNTGDLGYLEVIFGSVGFEDFITRFTAVTTITKADNDLVEKQKVAVKEVENKEEEVNTKLAEAEETKTKLTTMNELKKNQKEQLVKSVKSVEKEIESLESKKASYVKEGNDIKALEEKAEAIKQAKVAAEQQEQEPKEEPKEELTEEVKEEPKSKTKEAKVVVENTSSEVTEKVSNKSTQSKATSKPVTKPKPTPKPKPKETKKPTNNPTKQSKDSIKEITMSATGYTAKCSGCTGITATGINLNNNPNAKVVAVDPSVIPLGSRVWVSGYGEAIAGDTGGAIKGNKIDLHFPTKEAAYAFGRGTVTVKILK